MTPGRERALITVAGLATAGIAALGSGQVWYRTAGHGFTGSEITDGAEEALALAGLAGVAVTLLLGVWGRRVVGLLVVLLGLGALLVAALRRVPTSAQLDQVLGVHETTGSATGWPWVCVVAGGVLAGVGGLFLARAHRWRSPSDRFERGATRPERVVGSSLDAWKALDAGADPTAFDGNLTPEAPTGRRDQAGPASGHPTPDEEQP
ncbi:MAG TPA: Trp biosynthesis-associated membrane protein [Propionibacteriaceae bacterium]|nr:Trp biosynthesis-associated membrane protein [Propionibacteriaceae bacterium]